MAKISTSTPCKHLLLVALFLLCFISIGARARNLRGFGNKQVHHIQAVEKEQSKEVVTAKENGVPVVAAGKHEQAAESKKQLNKDQVLTTEDQNNGVPVDVVDELVRMDYTPARKKPPIHNP